MRLLADIGGSNARFALSPAPGRVEAERRYPTPAFASFETALAAYRAETGMPALAGVAVAAAGPVEAGEVRLTNAPWTIRAGELGALAPGGRAILLNDLEAVALALPRLGPGDVAPIGPAIPAGPGPRIAINLGTGFGAATALMLPGGGWTTAASEAGHMTLAPDGPEEAALGGRAWSIEDALSGPGVLRLHAALAPGASIRDAAELFAPGAPSPARRTVGLITRLLGRVAGDLALASAAWGGVYLTGSVAAAWAAVADPAAFRARFAAKGPMAPRLERVPTVLLTRPDPSLWGLSFAL